MERSLVSVIIVNRNGAHYLHSCLSSLVRQTYSSLEIIIVDNASTDNSLHVIRTFQLQNPEIFDPDNAGSLPGERGSSHSSLVVLRNTTNEGFCRGNNQGISQSQGEFILLLNADVTLAPRFIEVLVNLMRSEATIGITLGKLLSGHDPTRLDSTGISMLKNRRAVDRGQGEIDSEQYASREVFGASGATCLYRKTMLEDIKYHWDEIARDEKKRHEAAHDEYLDELFFAYKEDVDLSWRARLYGWKCVYTSEAVGQHFRRWGTGKRTDIPKWIRRHSLKNRYLMLIKNERWDTVAPHLMNIIWYELQSVMYILLREPYLFSVIGDIVRLWPDILKKRKLTHKKSCQRTPAEDIVRWFT